MIKNLQSLRGIAAVLIFYHHFGIENVFTDSFGDFGVTFFMILSGFVMEMAYGGRVSALPGEGGMTFGKFMLSRLTKIYPLYFICWFLAVAFLPYRGSREGILLSLFMLQSWVPEAPVYFAGNSVTWFISDLMFCYLMFVVIHRLSVRWPRNVIPLAALYFMAYFCVVLTLPQSLVHGIVYINPLMQLASFMIGMAMGHFFPSVRDSECVKRLRAAMTGLTVTVAEAAMIVIVCTAMWFYYDILQRLSFASYWWIPVAMTIIVFSLSDRAPGCIGRILHSRPLLKLGEVSFSFYIIHKLGIYAWQRLMEFCGVDGAGDMSMLLQSVVLIILIFFLSLLINRYLEPFASGLFRRIVHRLTGNIL